MTFDTVFEMMMLLVIVSWAALVVVAAVVCRSVMHPEYGDGDSSLGASQAPGGLDQGRQGAPASSRDRRTLAVTISASWWAPPLVAVGLALVSLPLVAVSLSILDTTHAVSSSTQYLALGDPRRWTSGAGAVLISAVFAGAIGAPAVRRRPIAGALFTFFVALIVAIGAFPLLPASLGDHVGEVVFCVDGCNAVVDSWDPSSGLRAAPFFAWAAFTEPVSVAALAIGVTIWSLVVRRLSKAARLAASRMGLADYWNT
jgi:hypothetical protein